MSKPTPRLSVLVVDDEPVIRHVFPRALGTAYEVVTAESAEQGLVLLEGGHFDVVVSDTNLGAGMRGPVFLAIVAERWPEMGRVIMSGCDRKVAETALTSRAAHVFMKKPWQLGEPVTYLREALARAASEERSA